MSFVARAAPSWSPADKLIFLASSQSGRAFSASPKFTWAKHGKIRARASRRLAECLRSVRRGSCHGKLLFVIGKVAMRARLDEIRLNAESGR